MNFNRYFKIIICLFILIWVLPACASSSDLKSIYGVWKTNPTLGQLGKTISTYSFEKNDFIRITITFIDAEIAEMKADGEFKLVGNDLVLKINEKIKNYTIQFEGKYLIMEGSNESIRLHRVE